MLPPPVLLLPDIIAAARKTRFCEGLRMTARLDVASPLHRSLVAFEPN
jgi:hypothetical protein